MQSHDSGLGELLWRAWGSDEPTAAIDATCRAIVEELAQDSGALILPADLCADVRFGGRRTIVVECARRIDLD